MGACVLVNVSVILYRSWSVFAVRSRDLLVSNYPSPVQCSLHHPSLTFSAWVCEEDVEEL